MSKYNSLVDTFEKVEFKGLVIDTYITDKMNVERTVAEKGYTLGYKKIRSDGSTTVKFATLMILGLTPTLVLHFGKKHENIGLILQEDLDRVIGKTYLRNNNQKTEKTHELFIRLDWIENLEIVVPFIDKAYEDRV